MTPKLWLAEFIGTFALVFVGIATLTSGASGLEVALAFGLTVSIMISAVGGLSYAHFNPAVSLGFWVMRNISFKMLLAYLTAEFAGAIVALACLKATLGSEKLELVSYGATFLAADTSMAQGFVIEVILTFFLMFVIATCVIQKQPQAGLYIGFTVAVCALAGGGFTGASMNPARSFAPALFSGVWSQHWLYWFAPVLGAILAALTATYLWRDSQSTTA